MVDLATKACQLRSEGFRDWLSSVRSKELPRIAHDYQQSHLAYKSFIGLRESRGPHKCFPSGNGDFVFDNRWSAVQNRQVAVTNVQNIPQPYTLHGVHITRSKHALITAAQVDLHGSSNGVTTNRPGEVMQPI